VIRVKKETNQKRAENRVGGKKETGDTDHLHRGMHEMNIGKKNLGKISVTQRKSAR